MGNLWLLQTFLHKLIEFHTTKAKPDSPVFKTFSMVFFREGEIGAALDNLSTCTYFEHSQTNPSVNLN